jgi:ankyrin repeat protein
VNESGNWSADRAKQSFKRHALKPAFLVELIDGNNPVARSLQQVLQSVSEVMFPAELGDQPVAIDSVGCDGDTPLHVLVWRNDLEGVQILIDGGADVDAQGEMGETPLHIAVTQHNIPIIQALLGAGTRDDIRCEFGDTPRERAKTHGEDLERAFAAASGI